MNLYHKKQRWKIILILIAIFLVGFSLWYSNTVVNKVAQKEKDRVTQWADAIKRKADLVNLTNNTFDALRENERKKVELWTLSMQEVNKDLTDYSFVLAVLTQSNQVPMIITNQKGEIENTHNLEDLNKFSKSEKKDTLNSLINIWKSTHTPLTLNLFSNNNQTVYYYDSKKLSALTYSKDSLYTAFTNELVNNTDLVPVLFIEKERRELIASNMPQINDTIDQRQLNEIIKQIAPKTDSISINFGQNQQGVIYYEASKELTILKYFPLVQFTIIGLFILIGYLVFSTFRKAEQDQVWVGMAKETAHQLGTPISSLMAWIQLLEAQGIDSSTILEMNKDIDRLNTVTNRFSKIGSKAILKSENIVPVIKNSLDYLRLRISKNIELSFTNEQNDIQTPINSSLLEWVIENITKNAVDAMDGKGSISVSIRQFENDVIIDITDNGKGIPPSKLKTVFQPGYTTKKRGWGLGLSLVKRIVEDFHKGKISVLKSEINVGTTFRIIFKAD